MPLISRQSRKFFIFHRDDHSADGGGGEQQTDGFQRQHVMGHQLIPDFPDRWLRFHGHHLVRNFARENGVAHQDEDDYCDYDADAPGG